METLSQRIEVEIAKRKAYTKLKLRESADRVKRGQCALTLQMNWSRAKDITICIRSRRWRQQKKTHRIKVKR